MAQRLLTLLAASGLLAAAPVLAQASTTQGPKGGKPLELVKSFDDDFRLVGIGASKTGRIFATAPAQNVRSRYSMVEIDPKTGTLTPYPDAEWNSFTDHPDGRPEWISLQALWDDKGRPSLGAGFVPAQAGPGYAAAKLVEFDLKTNTPIRTYLFKGVVSATDSLNDVRVDLVHGYAYLTNIGNKGSLVVLNLKSGESRQVLVGDRSTYADPQQHLMINGQPALRPDGSVVAIHADGIALSPDAKWLWYRPLTDHNYWRVPTAALIDPKLSPDALSKTVEYLGSAALTGGLIMDKHGTLYGGDLEHGTVVALTLKPGAHTLAEKVFASDPRLSWADGFAMSGGDLYLADSHLWELAFKNDLPRSGRSVFQGEAAIRSPAGEPLRPFFYGWSSTHYSGDPAIFLLRSKGRTRGLSLLTQILQIYQIRNSGHAGRGAMETP
ncbi:MAG: L-dopachrome tautomerase-related protein [Aliidongia sp.]